MYDNFMTGINNISMLMIRLQLKFSLQQLDFNRKIQDLPKSSSILY